MVTAASGDRMVAIQQTPPAKVRRRLLAAMLPAITARCIFRRYRSDHAIQEGLLTTVLTAGYQLRSLSEFIDTLVAQRVDVLLDVRETPWSHRRDFSRYALTAALNEVGILYVHAWFAGNPKEHRDNSSSPAECLALYERYLDAIPDVIEILNDLVAEMEAEGFRRICLMCFERNPVECHRSRLLARWRVTKGNTFRIVHIA